MHVITIILLPTDLRYFKVYKIDSNRYDMLINKGTCPQWHYARSAPFDCDPKLVPHACTLKYMYLLPGPTKFSTRTARTLATY